MDEDTCEGAAEHQQACGDPHLPLNGNRTFAVFDVQPRIDRGERAAFDDDGLCVAGCDEFFSGHARAFAALAENVNWLVGACALAVGRRIELVERVELCADDVG